MNEVLISIIIPVYNGEKYIKRCIESIVKQENKNIEIVIINDGSTDDTEEICNNYKQKYNNIILVNNSNTGVSYSRNNGVNIAHGKYIFFLDVDDYLKENSIEKMLNEIGQSDIVRFSYCILNDKDSKDVIFKNNEYIYNDSYKKKEFLEEYLNIQNQNMVWGQLIKRDILEGLKFDENLFFGEDLLYNYRLYKKSSNIKYSKEVIYMYEQSDTSVTKNYENHKVYNKIENLISIFTILTKEEKDKELDNLLKVRFLKEAIPQIMMLSFDKKIGYHEILEQYKKIVSTELLNNIFDCISLKNYKYKLFYKFLKNRNFKLMYAYSKAYKCLKHMIK